MRAAILLLVLPLLGSIAAIARAVMWAAQKRAEKALARQHRYEAELREREDDVTRREQAVLADHRANRDREEAR